MSKKVDARGLSCPQPVVLTKNALDNFDDDIEVIVDNPTARENVIRFSQNAGCKTNVSTSGRDYIIKIKR